MTRLALLGLLGLALQGPGALGGMPPRVKFVLRNLCGRPIELYWIMPKGQNEINGQRQLVLQGPAVKNSSAMPIDSFVGHEFIVRPTDSPRPPTRAAARRSGRGTRRCSRRTSSCLRRTTSSNLLPNMELERWDARHRAMRVIAAAVAHCQAAGGGAAAASPSPSRRASRASSASRSSSAATSRFVAELRLEAKLHREMWAEMEKYGGGVADRDDVTASAPADESSRCPSTRPETRRRRGARVLQGAAARAPPPPRARAPRARASLRARFSRRDRFSLSLTRARPARGLSRSLRAALRGPARRRRTRATAASAGGGGGSGRRAARPPAPTTRPSSARRRTSTASRGGWNRSSAS